MALERREKVALERYWAARTGRALSSRKAKADWTRGWLTGSVLILVGPALIALSP